MMRSEQQQLQLGVAAVVAASGVYGFAVDVASGVTGPFLGRVRYDDGVEHFLVVYAGRWYGSARRIERLTLATASSTAAVWLTTADHADDLQTVAAQAATPAVREDFIEFAGTQSSSAFWYTPFATFDRPSWAQRATPFIFCRTKFTLWSATGFTLNAWARVAGRCSRNGNTLLAANMGAVPFTQPDGYAAGATIVAPEGISFGYPSITGQSLDGVAPGPSETFGVGVRWSAL